MIDTKFLSKISFFSKISFVSKAFLFENLKKKSNFHVLFKFLYQSHIKLADIINYTKNILIGGGGRFYLVPELL